MPTEFCRHIRINGERCGSPALRSETFCYYHIEQGRRHRRTTPRPSSVPINNPVLSAAARSAIAWTMFSCDATVSL